MFATKLSDAKRYADFMLNSFGKFQQGRFWKIRSKIAAFLQEAFALLP
jgi:hypothetical protein